MIAGCIAAGRQIIRRPSTRRTRSGRIADNPAAVNLQDAAGCSGDFPVVCNQQNRDAGAVQPFENRRDLHRRLTIQISGRFVRENQSGRTGDGACDRNALLLAARHLGRVMCAPVRQAHKLERGQRRFTARSRGDGFEDKPQLDILKRGHAGHKVIVLEHKTDQIAAEFGQPPVAEAGNLAAVKIISAAVGPVK